ncbi:MAG: recombinase family protein, partial [Bacteroidales bacterium]
KLEGKGSNRIARELNQTDLWKPTSNRLEEVDRTVPLNPIKRKKNITPSWRKSYIEKILNNNRAVIGEYQPHVIVGGKRIPEGDPIQNYYPVVVNEKKFYQVQALIDDNGSKRAQSGGRNDKVSNLFGHMAVCKACGSPMQFQNKGYTSKGGQYLICDKELRQIDGGCTMSRLKYNIVEQNVLNYCVGLQVKDIITDDKIKATELGIKQKKQLEIKGQIQHLQEKIDRINETIGDTENRDVRKILAHTLSIHIETQKSLDEELININTEIKKLEQNTENHEERLKDIRDLYKRMKELDGEALLTLRLSLRSHLRSLIKKIAIDSNKGNLLIYFQSGQRRSISLGNDGIPKILDAYPKSEGYIKTSDGYIKGN